MNTVEWVKKHGLLEYLWKHTSDFYVLVGVDGYPSGTKIGDYFEKKYLPKFAEKIIFVTMMLMGKYDHEIYYRSYDNVNVSFKELGDTTDLDEISTLIKSTIVDCNGTLEFLFTDSDECQFLMEIGNTFNVDFFNMNGDQKKYITELLNKINLALCRDEK